MQQDHPRTESVQFGSVFAQYADAAIVRISVLFPEVTFNRVAECCVKYALPEGTSMSADSFRREFLHTQYREKIYQETLLMRQRLVEALTH